MNVVIAGRLLTGSWQLSGELPLIWRSGTLFAAAEDMLLIAQGQIFAEGKTAVNMLNWIIATICRIEENRQRMNL